MKITACPRDISLSRVKLSLSGKNGQEIIFQRMLHVKNGMSKEECADR